MFKRIIIVLWVVSLTACGFQLRGSFELPQEMTRTYIQAGNQQDEMIRQLRRLLKANEVQLVADRGQATAVLVIEQNRIERVVQSVGATARVREFALEYRVAFRLDDTDGKALMGRRDLELIRDFTFNEQEVLGTASEEELQRRDMQRSMASRVLDVLSSR